MKKSLLAGMAMMAWGVCSAAAGVVEDRQTIMTGFNTANNDLLGMTRDTYSPSAAAALIQVISAGAAKLDTLFPPGSGADAGTDTGTGTAKTRALPTVWSDAPGFQAALAKLIADLKTAQEAKDPDSFGVAYSEAAADCNDCHRLYRARPPRAPR